MTSIKSIHRRTIYQSIFKYFLFVAFAISFSFIFFIRTSEKQLSDFFIQDYKVTIWSNDFHIR
jgi:hypothetical protein